MWARVGYGSSFASLLPWTLAKLAGPSRAVPEQTASPRPSGSIPHPTAHAVPMLRPHNPPLPGSRAPLGGCVPATRRAPTPAAPSTPRTAPAPCRARR